jgi:hypothetical protein
LKQYEGSRTVYLAAEYGAKGDEGSMAEIVCRTRWFVSIGPNGGIKSLNKNGTWIEGRRAGYINRNVI